MLNFFAGIFSTLLVVWILLTLFKNSIKKDLDEANNIKLNLEKLYEEYLRTTGDMTQKLETRINEANEIIQKIENFAAMNITEQSNNSLTYSKNKCKNRSRDKKDDVNKLCSLKHTQILELFNSGNSIKEISEKLGLEQDQVSMILQLYNK